MTTQTPNETDPYNAQRPIVFFDGDCMFCNQSVQTLLGLDDNEQLDFAPLQGKTAARLLPESLRHPDQLGTMVYRLPNGALFTRSSAALAILSTLGGPYKIASAAGRLLPRALRDAAYDLVARNRHRLAAKSACALPAERDRKRFLD